MLAVVVLAAAYVGASELLKSWFYCEAEPQPLREFAATPLARALL